MKYVCTLCAVLSLVCLCLLPSKLYANNIDIEAFKAYAVFKLGNYDKAYEMWKKLADEGSPSAMNNIANLYENGFGFARDLTLAVKWYRLSAEAGNSLGQLHLATAYKNGKGIVKDEQQALTWYRKSAEQGDQDAQFNLGVMLLSHYELKQDPSSNILEDARYWLEQAHLQNHPEAKRFLKTLPSNKAIK